MSLGSQVKKYREMNNWTLEQLESRSGVSAGTIGALEVRKSERSKYASNLASAFGLTVEQLLDESVNWVELKKQGISKQSEPNLMPLGIRKEDVVPLISWVAAGFYTATSDPFQPGDADEWLSCPVPHGPHTYALKVRGESMFNPNGPKSFSDGDIIFVDPERNPNNGSLVVVRNGEAEATFKRLLIDGDQRYLEALNPSWPERIKPIKENTVLCGVVIAKMEVFA